MLGLFAPVLTFNDKLVIPNPGQLPPWRMIGRLKSHLVKQSPPTRTKEYANRVFKPNLVLVVSCNFYPQLTTN